MSPRAPRTASIAQQLSVSLFFLAIACLLLTGGGLIYLAFQAQTRQLAVLQQERSASAADEISAYMDDLQRKLGYLARVRGMTTLPPATQQRMLEGLARHNSAYEALAIADRHGRVVASYAGDRRAFPREVGQSTPFLRAYRLQEDYVAPVGADPGSHLPVTTLAVPIRDAQDRVDGALLARIDLSYLWFIVSQIDVGRTGYAYVLDERNVLIAKKGDTAKTFKLVDVSDRPFVQRLTQGKGETRAPYRGLSGAEVIGSIAPVGAVRWNVVVELPTAEAYAPIRSMLLVMGLALAGGTLAAVGLGRLFARQITRPLERLTEAATRITAGETGIRVDDSSRNELGILAGAFNEMTSQLVEMIDRLEERVQERTQQLEAANRELEAFSYSVSHDLRAPLRSIEAFSEMLEEDYRDRLDATGVDYLRRVRKASERMGLLIEDLLQLSRVSRGELRQETVDLTRLARAIVYELQQTQPDRRVRVEIADGLQARGDPRLLEVALDNMLGNAWKYTGKREDACIELGELEQDGQRVFYVRDNGTGFDMARADKLFIPFQRLHSAEEFPGTGIGLATVQRIIQRHGGAVWAESEVDRGATFYFRL